MAIPTKAWIKSPGAEKAISAAKKSKASKAEKKVLEAGRKQRAGKGLTGAQFLEKTGGFGAVGGKGKGARQSAWETRRQKYGPSGRKKPGKGKLPGKEKGRVSGEKAKGFEQLSKRGLARAPVKGTKRSKAAAKKAPGKTVSPAQMKKAQERAAKKKKATVKQSREKHNGMRQMVREEARAAFLEVFQEMLDQRTPPGKKPPQRKPGKKPKPKPTRPSTGRKRPTLFGRPLVMPGEVPGVLKHSAKRIGKAALYAGLSYAALAR